MTSITTSKYAVPSDDIIDLIQASNLQHIAIIMDGNRRWAKERNESTIMGHQAGVISLRNIVRYASDAGIKALTVYAFSTENWKRQPAEVDALMQLFIQTMRAELAELKDNAVKARFIGDTTSFSEALQYEINTMTDETAHNDGLCFQIAMNYGSRAELVNAMQTIAQQIKSNALTPEAITEQVIESALYTQGLPDLDLVIRTGGEYRLSNYLLWQAAYAEIYITDVLWPEFTPTELDKAINTFAQRQRRYGK